MADVSLASAGRLFNQLSPGQRVLTVVLGGGTIVALVLLAMWVSSPQFAILYAGLDPEEAGAIVDRLQSDQVEYKLQDGGRTVMVPRDKVYEVRLRLANQGLPRGGGRGYEIMDQGKLGWSDFVQKFQHRRALEGEIARTIQTLDEIRQARVHLVVPEPSLFTEDEKPTTASVVVALRPGSRLGGGHVRGMVHLVASAVEGLVAENVTVLDTSGNLLSSGMGENGFAATSEQMSLTRDVEQRLAEKAQSMLDAVLGPNKSIVRLTAELDWEKVDRTIESYDADNPAVVSEQTTSGVNPDGTRTENAVTNYEISRRVEHVIGAAGTIKKLTGAVFVDGTYTEQPDGTRGYQARTPEEMKKLSELTKAAVGFDAGRGDELQVENISFDTSAQERQRRQMEKSHRLQQIVDLATRVGGIVVALLLILGFRSLLKRFSREAPPPASAAPQPVGSGAMQPAEGDPREAEVRRLANESPEVTARLVRAWIHGG
ncbi:MAG: flagellar M-ring protein FliF [Candidatus Eisenbacteria bacterium]|nr:flagellar M-ring protein FliF [Candidatus Eisenbacteria bacterium]